MVFGFHKLLLFRSEGFLNTGFDPTRQGFSTRISVSSNELLVRVRSMTTGIFYCDPGGAMRFPAAIRHLRPPPQPGMMQILGIIEFGDSTQALFSPRRQPRLRRRIVVLDRLPPPTP